VVNEAQVVVVTAASPVPVTVDVMAADKHFASATQAFKQASSVVPAAIAVGTPTLGTSKVPPSRLQTPAYLVNRPSVSAAVATTGTTGVSAGVLVSSAGVLVSFSGTTGSLVFSGVSLVSSPANSVMSISSMTS